MIISQTDSDLQRLSDIENLSPGLPHHKLRACILEFVQFIILSVIVVILHPTTERSCQSKLFLLKLE